MANVKKQVFFRRNHCFKVFGPREMPLEHSHLATHGNYLTEEEETSIISLWTALCTRLVRQKAISPNDIFSNLLASRPDDVKDSLILPDLMLTSTPPTAKCKLCFSAMNHLKFSKQFWVRTPFQTWCKMYSSDHAMKAYRPHSAISNWFSGAKAQQRDTFWRYSN